MIYYMKTVGIIITLENRIDYPQGTNVNRIVLYRSRLFDFLLEG